MNQHLLRIAIALSVALGMIEHGAEASLLHHASLLSGDYGDGSLESTTIPTASASFLSGIVNSPDGTKFISTEADGRSNALINWQNSDYTARQTFRSQGTISFWLKVDPTFVPGEIIGENKGYGTWNNGQGSFAANLSPRTTGPLVTGAQLNLKEWYAGYPGNWYYSTQPNQIGFDRWYDVGFAWGDHGATGAAYDVEIWVDGELVSGIDLPPGAFFPWGDDRSGLNVGLGSNHQRGCDAYYASIYGWYCPNPAPVFGSVAGVTLRDVDIWNEYRALGNTTLSSVPEPSTLLLGAGLAGLAGLGLRRSRRK